MKILRKELADGFSHKFFEIPVDSLDLEDLRFYEKCVTGEITCEKMSNGYHLKGHLSIPFIEECDRCLAEFRQTNKPEYTIILTNHSEIAEDPRNIDVLYFPDNMDSIEIGPVFQDLVRLEEPFKKICKSDCKGLCAMCGNDLNVAPCNCSIPESDSQWEKLNKLNQ